MLTSNEAKRNARMEMNRARFQCAITTATAAAALAILSAYPPAWENLDLLTSAILAASSAILAASWGILAWTAGAQTIHAMRLDRMADRIAELEQIERDIRTGMEGEG